MNFDCWLEAWRRQPIPTGQIDLRQVIAAADAHRKLDRADRVSLAAVVVMLGILLFHAFHGSWSPLDGLFAVIPTLLIVQLLYDRRERHRRVPQEAGPLLEQLDRDILRTEQWLRGRRWFWASPTGGVGLGALVCWLFLWCFLPEFAGAIPFPPSPAGWTFFVIFVGLLGWGQWHQFSEHRSFLLQRQELAELRDRFRRAGGPPATG